MVGPYGEQSMDTNWPALLGPPSKKGSGKKGEKGVNIYNKSDKGKKNLEIGHEGQLATLPAIPPVPPDTNAPAENPVQNNNNQQGPAMTQEQMGQILI